MYVEEILKCSLNLIPSPSVKILIMVGKIYLRCKGKTLLGVVNKLLKKKSFLRSRCKIAIKKFVEITQQCFALLPPVNFAVHNLNFY